MTASEFSIVVLAALGLLFLAVERLQRQGALGFESGRKLVHVGMGCLCLALPWFFGPRGPVWLLAGIATAFLISVRIVPAVRARLGGVLGGVTRHSFGDVFFPLGVASAFTLAGGDKAAFCSGVGLLAFGDTAGAVFGMRWGRTPFPTAGGRKSVEGSLAFLLVSVAWVFCVLILLGRFPAPAAGEGAFVVGAVAMVIEASAGYGFDNALVPAAAVEMTAAWATGDISHRSTLGKGLIAVSAAVVLIALLSAVRAWAREDPPGTPGREGILGP